jgi:hypothetical protein
MSSGPSPVPVLVAALAVLSGGVVALVVHDDARQTAAPPVLTTNVPTTGASSRSTSTSASTGSTLAPLSTAPTTSFVATTVRPSVTSPEAAANGLWAAYTNANETAAKRFATDEVVRVLFEEPYNGETGAFRSCRAISNGFECRYTQPSAEYSMTVEANGDAGYQVVEITVTPT